MSHTPGPWKVHDESDRYPFEIYPTRGGTRIAAVTKQANGHDLTPEMGKANARLIAAAPDLLAALRAVRDDAAEHDDEVSAETMDKVEAAVAKAEGR